MRCISILLFVLSINFQGASVRAGDDKPGSIADLRDWCDDKGGSYFRQGAGIPARCDFQDNRSFTQVPQEKPVITEKKVDLEKIKERHKHCKEKGKFKGDKCAMLFIADESEPALTPPEEEE